MSYALNTTTRKLQFLLGGAVSATQPTCVVSFADQNQSGELVPTLPQLSTANNTTAVDICDAPPQNYYRLITGITVYNADSASVTVTVRYNDNGTMYVLNKSTLLTGETLGYTSSLGWYALDVNGNLKQVTSSTFAGLSSTGAVSITDTTQSTSATTGALKVSGGVGIAKNLYTGGALVTAATASGGAGLNVPHGTAPSSPTNGDVWTTTAGLYARINGATVGPYIATASGGITNIANGSLSGATVDVSSIAATYAYLRLTLTGASVDTATRQPQVQIGNGSPDTTASNYVMLVNAAAGSTASLVEGVNGAAAVTWNMSINLYGYQGGSGYANYSGTLTDSNGNNRVINGTYYGTTSAIDVVRFLINGSGNFDAGTYRVDGIS